MNMIKLIAGLITFTMSGIISANDVSDRVYIKDVAGIWVNEGYVEQLKNIRMPHQVAKNNPPVVIAIRSAGNSYPIVVTDFREAALNVVLAVEPNEEKGSYRLVLAPDNKPTPSDEVKYLWFKGIKTIDGNFKQLDMAEIFFKNGVWDSYINVGEKIGPFINRHVIAGRYKDESGDNWEFSPEGQAYLPDQTFYYEMSLRDDTSNCEYIEGEDMNSSDGIKRIGFSWMSGKLHLFEADLVDNRVICKSKAFKVLIPS